MLKAIPRSYNHHQVASSAHLSIVKKQIWSFRVRKRFYDFALKVLHTFTNRQRLYI